ncbi:uncharacterized protein HGUI_03503 [Hanseniaspora guilliermondii]|uniref:mRNA export factor GLE1 n=1 Tax=Hanseniaspora guilliermondii TaxID=56406 RepID=A0A1L0D2D3_9ASCO|nr:uncharacterized protein HGUI_03503 [Hanseniaspora guilliermondii]
MANNVINKYSYYQRKRNESLKKNQITKPSNKSKVNQYSCSKAKNESLLKDIELKLIPSLKVISLVSNKMQKEVKDYNTKKEHYNTSMKKYNDAVNKELEHQKKLQKEKDEKEALRKQQEEEREKELFAKKEKERLEKLKESAKYMYSSARVIEEFKANKKRILDIEQTIRIPVENSPDLKQVYAQKRLINPAFGQLTNSRRHLIELTSKVIGYINQTKVQPLAYQWILNFTAKGLCKQAELECRVKPEMAIPLAEMAHLLNEQFPELIPQFLIPRLIKKCPVLIGYISNDKNEMGFKVKEPQNPEMKSVYLERMDGLLAFYSMLCKTQNSNNITLDLVWKMITRWANRNIKSMDGDLVFGSLVTVLECCGSEFDQKFGKQANKLINVFLVGAFKEEFSSSVNWKRLMIMVEDKLSSGKYKTFQGMIND